MKKNQKGFSLIELLIVVAIILIIAAIAIPNLLRARMAANESSAVGTLRSINTANATYETLYNFSFANSLPVLGGATAAAGVVAPCTAANLIDNVLSASNTPTKSGYNFTYTGANPNTADTAVHFGHDLHHYRRTGYRRRDGQPQFLHGPVRDHPLQPGRYGSDCCQLAVE